MMVWGGGVGSDDDGDAVEGGGGDLMMMGWEARPDEDGVGGVDLMMTGWQAENERRAWRVCWGAVHNEELKQHRFVQPALKDVEITGSYPSHPYHPGRPPWAVFPRHPCN